MPDVTGMGLEAARERLAAAGFQVTVRRASLYVGVQYVVTTDPAGGTKAPRGSTSWSASSELSSETAPMSRPQSLRRRQ